MAGSIHVSDAPAALGPRDVFCFFTGGAKVDNPRAAESLMERLG